MNRRIVSRRDDETGAVTEQTILEIPQRRLTSEESKELRAALNGAFAPEKFTLDYVLGDVEQDLGDGSLGSHNPALAAELREAIKVLRWRAADDSSRELLAAAGIKVGRLYQELAAKEQWPVVKTGRRRTSQMREYQLKGAAARKLDDGPLLQDIRAKQRKNPKATPAMLARELRDKHAPSARVDSLRKRIARLLK